MQKLLFVYNGDSGLFNGVIHYLHKRISPETYPCALCGLVYDGTQLNKDWLSFVRSLGVPSEFLHRDEFARKYGKAPTAWPAVLLDSGTGTFEIVITAADFARIGSIEALQARLARFAAPAGERPSAAL